MNITAVLDNETIKTNEIDALIQPELYESLFNTYYARKLMTEEVITKKLIEKEAVKLGITKDSLYHQIVCNCSISLPQYIQENNFDRGIPDSNFPGQLISIAETEGKLRVEKYYNNFCVEKFIEIIRADHHVDFFLKAPLTPKIDLSQIQYNSMNSIRSKNVIWIFSDFDCFRCQEFFPTLVLLESKFGKKIEFRYTSVASISTRSMLVAEFAANKGKFWEACKAIFKRQSSKQLNPQDILESIGLRYDDFKRYTLNNRTAERHYANYQRLVRLGKFQVTPTLVINNRIYHGDLSFSQLSGYINGNLE